MILNELKPRKVLNKAFLKVRPNRIEIENFKTNLTNLLNGIDEKESEEFHKNLVIDFLKKTYYDPNHFINTKDRKDLVIHNGDTAKSSVGVIIEAKKPTNKSEMPTKANLNVKAFQELVLYYLRERITHKNLEIKNLIITNVYEWFVFDAQVFDRLFAQNKQLVKSFTEFEAGTLVGSKTDFFYEQIAKPFIAQINTEIEFTHFNLKEYQSYIQNQNKADDNHLIVLFKLLSPEHLLKLPFANDSNSLDKRFYSELLHIIGLSETKEGGKKLIERNKEGERNSGTILEDAIIQLDSLDKISRLEKPSQFGNSSQERLFNVALELSITWINRVLFLKLLEAQLISYHKGDKNYTFLSLEKIKDYDDLNSLFFQVLARKHDERNSDVKQAFEKVPYLNSSLFEPTELEHTTVFISNLRDEKTIPLHSKTVLKNEQGKALTGNLNTLEYLFRFLDAYDFSSEGSEEIQEDNKTLINASVLGLIFEKINGYKDGSFFTPGFITMYMCRETIRKAVLQKFKETKNWDCNHLEELYDKITDRKEANEIVNSLKICDPAVGSGHFLVSALNEMIAIKSELQILQDAQGKRLKNYTIEVVNDELIVTDEDGELFEYNPKNPESQRIQETLFHEKQTIIENCLFGVDINPNSVKICRLRLWIELLKNAYYKNETELETLPNIDINIKVGNSLVSRFALDADLSQALKKSRYTIDSYQIAVDTYRNAQNKEQKREMERLISDIKSDFRSEIAKNDPKLNKKRKLEGDLFTLMNQTSVFGETEKEKKEKNKKAEKLTQEIQKIEAELEEIKNNKIFENAFEWRFEFPEILDNEGNFVGFDVVIGNPPYIRQEDIKELKPYLQNNYQTFAGTADLFVYFIELGLKNLKNKGEFVFIIPNKWMRAGYGKSIRNFIKQYKINSIIDFGDLPVFEEATTYPCILNTSKNNSENSFEAVNVNTLVYPEGLEHYLHTKKSQVNVSELGEEGWVLSDSKIQNLITKIKNAGVPLTEYVNGKIFYGIKTGYNEAFVIDEETKKKLIEEDPKSEEIIKPFLAGRDIKRYQQPKSNKYLILFRNGDTKQWFGENNEETAWKKLSTKYSAICKYISQFTEKAKKRQDMGQYWWELRPCDYYGEFEKDKIIYPNICKQPEFSFDNTGYYANQKCFIMPNSDKYLLGFLNSKLSFFLFKNILPKLRGDFYEPSYVYLKNFPININESLEKEGIKKLVNQILELKAQDPKADTQALEAEIDQMVYALYGLTEEEIKIVEGN